MHRLPHTGKGQQLGIHDAGAVARRTGVSVGFNAAATAPVTTGGR
jgi:hypothetical protein